MTLPQQATHNEEYPLQPRGADADMDQGASAATVTIAPGILSHADARRLLRWCARRLERGAGDAARIETAFQETERRAKDLGPALAADVVCCASVLCDLRAQGWRFRVERSGIVAIQPTAARNAGERKTQVRAAHLVERDAQLSRPAVRRFIREMERPRPFAGQWHSIFSLMRDGRDLAAALSQTRALAAGPKREAALRACIDPYVQVVDSKAVCPITGLRLLDVWRYFRHTWSITYNSTPGRKMFVLIRDRASPNHPVIGIGALGSAIVQLGRRDEWIGWTGEAFVERLRREPTAAWAKWVDGSLTALLEDIRIADLLRLARLREANLERPTQQAIERLRAIGRSCRAKHRMLPQRHRHKAASHQQEIDWGQQSSTHLFRAKRAEMLVELLEIRRRLANAGFTGRPTATMLRRALGDRDAVRAIQSLVRFVKAAHVGVDMMDITVCGAVAPYNSLIGGKLVSLLMASPDVVRAYNTRYRKASSVIASSMAGRPVRRRPRLVLLGTTSLYDKAASQYNRLRIPVEVLDAGMPLAFVPVGSTEGYGSYHFSPRTAELLNAAAARRQAGHKVNSIFGEGVNPRFRKVRGALDLLGFQSDALLQHGSARLIYAVPLAENFREVLLGRDRTPRYILNPDGDGAERIAAYWNCRWLQRRIERDDVIQEVASHTLIYPVRHGARVPLPADPNEIGTLFEADDRA